MDTTLVEPWLYIADLNCCSCTTYLFPIIEATAGPGSVGTNLVTRVWNRHRDRWRGYRLYETYSLAHGCDVCRELVLTSGLEFVQSWYYTSGLEFNTSTITFWSDELNISC
eukprot:scaffold2888_cov65-Cylindrotheca_fusiformis.AAC.1